MRRLLPILLLLGAAPLPAPVATDLIVGETLPARLSDFRFFVDGRSNARVAPYALISPLFSDYTDKDRFVFVPAGRTASYAADGRVLFPVGSAIIKTFRSGRTKIETRVLLHREAGWVALPYVWQGDDAVLKRAGTRVPVTVAGRAIDYAVPNVNQCKECHASNGKLVPIGPKASNLQPGDTAHWRKTGLLTGSANAVPFPRFDDSRAPVASRARAYLDVNCAHCHSPAGSASNSGLYLSWETTDPTALGIAKTPVAAGRGSGGFAYAIDPGQPGRSIMVHRMKSTEPGVAMPELGRATMHDEGVKLVSDWIATMPKSR